MLILNSEIILDNTNQLFKKDFVEFKKKFLASLVIQINHLKKNYKFEEDTTLKNSISGLNISDSLVMKNWLIYAKKINDLTYKKFSIDISANDYMEKKMFNQVEFRRNEFSKTK